MPLFVCLFVFPSSCESLLVWPLKQDQFALGDHTKAKQIALNNIAPGIMCAHKPLHHDKVAIQTTEQKSTQQLN